MRAPLLALMFVLPALLSAQDVPVHVNGQTGVITGLPPIYNGQYVIQQTTFGFLWLDTVALQGGHVQAISVCVAELPTSDSPYVLAGGDCNAISEVDTIGNQVVAKMWSGQCGAQRRGCGGPRDDGHMLLAFGLGSWEYTGAGSDIGNSTQAADPQGRTWTARGTDGTYKNFVWHATGGTPPTPTPTPTPAAVPPTARATATNLSAQARGDSVNYYGDKWLLQDSSAPGPLTRIDWDFNYTGSFHVDETGGPATEATIVPAAYFPCDPSGAVPGTIRNGLNCLQSLGLTNPPASGSYQIALQSANQYGTSPNTFTSPAFPVVCPQASIVAYTGSTGTCVKSGGALTVLIGGNADASASLGNNAEASFHWDFTLAAPPTFGVDGANVGVPAGATAFTLTITYPGGFQAIASGTVSQTSLVPRFSHAPDPVLRNTTLTLTNLMDKLPTTTLDSVDYQVATGACGVAPSSGYTVLANASTSSGFLARLGTVPVTAPSSVSGYCVYLKYNFTPGAPPQQSLVASNGFTVTDSTPTLGIFTDSAATQQAGFFGGAIQLSVGTTYYLKDTENVAPPSAHFYLNSGSGDVELSGSPTVGPGPLAWTPSVACPSGCTVKVSTGAATDSKPVVISGAQGPTPTPTNPPSSTPTPTPPGGGGGGGSVSVFVNGPSTGSRGAAVGFTASASGGSGSYTYSWSCNFSAFAPSFSQGGQSQTCTYQNAGSYTVVARAVDGVGTTGYSPGNTVTITGLPAPSSASTLSGPTLTLNTFNGRYTSSNGSPVTFTATETEGNAASFAWAFGDGSPAGSGRIVTHTYSSSGSYSASLTVSGNGTTTTGTASATINIDITGPPAPSVAYTVTGATATGINAYNAEAGRAITFTASATQASSYAWDFGDETKSGKSVGKSYSAVGARTVRLTVTGDGTNTVGTANVNIAMNITPPAFRAVIIPGVAHLDDGTTTWGTDVSVTNSGTTSMNVGLAFVPWDVGPPSRDLSTFDYGSPVAIGPGGSYSVSDVVGALGVQRGQGTLVIKYEGGTRAPLATARVYFRPKVNPGNVSYGSGLSAYEVDGAGNISPQGFVSVALADARSGLQTESETETLDVTLTVNVTGSGSGIVTSSPGGISCSATCSASFPIGTSVQLTGSAGAGSTFAGITGCDSVVYGQCGLVLDSSKTVTARFDGSGPPPANNFTLSVNKTGAGTGTVSSAPAGISCGATCSALFAQGTSLSLTATPDSGSTFSGWGGACSGTGACSVTLSADASATATFTSTPAPSQQGDQVLIGLRSDPRYRFVVTLFNAARSQGNFELRATDDQGSPVLILDGAGNRVAARKVNNLGSYQQVYLRDSDLGLDDGKHYVLKGTSTAGTLLAFGTALDKNTNDLVQISDDSQASAAEEGIVAYWVAGVSRIDTAAHWRTDLRIFNRGSKSRNLYFKYSYLANGVEYAAQVDKLSIAAGELKTWDDVVGTLLATDTRVDLSGDNAGILRVYYPADDESATRPLVIGSRNYSDLGSAGTAGSQLALYTPAQAAGPGQNLYLSGAEDSDRYGSRIGVFAIDPGPVTFRIVAVDPSGNEVGSLVAQLGGSGVHWGQLDLNNSDFNFRNPGKPVSIRIDQISGGRVAAYAFTVDKVTLDTNFIQALPQN